MSMNSLLEQSGHQFFRQIELDTTCAFAVGSFLLRYYQLRFHSRLHQLNCSVSSRKGIVADSWAGISIKASSRISNDLWADITQCLKDLPATRFFLNEGLP